MLREEDSNQDLLAEYAFLDELDYPGWAWEFLRRNDEYRADYAHLQTLKRPEPFESEYESLSLKWHVRPFQSPDSKEAPEFFHERWQNIPADLMFSSPHEWRALLVEMQSSAKNLLTWKRSVIAKDLRDSGYSLNKAAKKLYPAYRKDLVQEGDTNHPCKHLVRGDLLRLKKLQAEYLQTAL
jgi:hypothetical protein